MANTTKQKKKTKAPAREESDEDESSEQAGSAHGGGENGAANNGPALSDRAASGMRIAKHLQKAAAGGNLRKGFSLWRASKELPTAAAGAGELFMRHPVPISLLGGVLTTAGLLYAAYSMGAFEQDGSAEQGEEGEDEGNEAEGRAESDEGGEEEGADDEE